MVLGLILCLLFALFPTWGVTQELTIKGQPQPLLVQQASGSVNWTEGTIVARGFGASPPNVAAAAAGAMAQRAAMAVAQRNLLEVIQGIHVDAETVVEKLILKKDEINARVHGVIRNANIIERLAHSDGSVELKVSMRLWGKDSLASTLLEEKKFSQANLAASSGQGGYTGVEFDTRGLRVTPAMFPTVADEDGRLVYGPDMVSHTAVTDFGFAQYALGGEPRLARHMGATFYMTEKQRRNPVSRVGARPLRIKGLQKLGSFNANIIISNADAQKIRQAPSILRALNKAKVIIITDPLVAGIEGRLLTPGEQLVLDLPNSNKLTVPALLLGQKIDRIIPPCTYDYSFFNTSSSYCDRAV